MKQIMRAIGLMSGTSMDGIDVALIETDGKNHVRSIAHMTFAYDVAFKKRIEQSLSDAKMISKRYERPAALDQLEHDITYCHVEAVNSFLRENNLNTKNIDVIGFHGQTVLHMPQKALTVQLGKGKLLANETGIDVVFDMRANDMENGGQGAPLVPIYHQALANWLDNEAQKKDVGFVNIGGISNATFISPFKDPVAFDCGPGNALIDQWVLEKANMPYDEGGNLSAIGVADDMVISQYMKVPFFNQTGPKSLDRNDFTLDYVREMTLENGAATLAKLTAQAIAHSMSDLSQMPVMLIVCGGGAHNKSILFYLKQALGSKVDVLTAGAIGLNADIIEAEAWAYLAVRSMKKMPLTFPTTTGCSHPVSGGVMARTNATS